MCVLRDSATANVTNVSVHETFADGTAAGAMGSTEPQVRAYRLAPTDVCGREIRTVGLHVN